MEAHKLSQNLVQLECHLDKIWIPVVRYDTAHGFAHCDKLHPYEPTVKTRMATQDYNDALTVAIQDLTVNWQQYRERYKTWKTQR